MPVCPTCGQEYDPCQLTIRELEVLEHVARGEANKEIGCGLGITANTVKNHLTRTFVKLGVSTRTEAVLACVRRGLIRL